MRRTFGGLWLESVDRHPGHERRFGFWQRKGKCAFGALQQQGRAGCLAGTRVQVVLPSFQSATSKNDLVPRLAYQFVVLTAHPDLR